MPCIQSISKQLYCIFSSASLILSLHPVSMSCIPRLSIVWLRPAFCGNYVPQENRKKDTWKEEEVIKIQIQWLVSTTEIKRVNSVLSRGKAAKQASSSWRASKYSTTNDSSVVMAHPNKSLQPLIPLEIFYPRI